MRGRQEEPLGSDVGGVRGESADLTLKAEGPGLEEAVAEAAVDGAEVEQGQLVSGRESGEIILIAINVEDGVGGNLLRIAAREDVLA